MRQSAAVRLLAVLFLLIATARADPQPAPPAPQKRWVYVPSNLYVDDNIPKLEALLRRAQVAGYNGVLFADYKTAFWWTLDDPARWKRNALALRRLTRDLGLELVVCVMPFGRADSLLTHNVNLASGLPVKEAPLVAHHGRLVPEQTAAIANGSFEDYRGNRATRFSFQDDPGTGSFIDTNVVKDGKASLRFEHTDQANPHGLGRICQSVRVVPWQQYRLRAWMKTDHLTAGEIQLLVLADGRALQHQFLAAWRNGRRDYAASAHDLTTDWIEQRVTFNSLGYTNVNVYAGIWDGKGGRIWWDDLRLDAVPTLNVLRRDSLPVTLVGTNGTPYVEGRDFLRLADPGLGTVPWAGAYDTQHEPPDIRLPAGSRIREGQHLRLSGYHTALVYDGQVNCSMAEPEVFDRVAEEVRRVREACAPDGYFLSHDEIRCAGWEPVETAGCKTSGELFAHNIARCYEIARREGGGKPVYVWSDMFDPNHNAHADYFLVNNTIFGSWEGLDPHVIVMKWGGGPAGRRGLEFFAHRGNPQMIAAYYDGSVPDDYREWMAASNGVPGIVGVMYTTWEDNFSNLEAFAARWWGGGPKATAGAAAP